MRSLLSGVVLPSDRDLSGTALAIARLQQVYDLTIHDLANGTILHRKSSVKLTTYDLMMIAHESNHIKHFVSAWIWYQHAMESTTDPEMKEHIVTLMTPIAIEHDTQRSQGYLDSQLFPKYLLEDPHQGAPDSSYFKLCRGTQTLERNEVLEKLKCYITNRGSPYLLLQPVKIEQLHYSPYIYFFYDVISDSHISAIQKVASDKLDRGLILYTDGPSETRVTQTAWLKNDSHPALLSLERRISYMTGLHVFEGNAKNMAGEPLQVQSYGVGGHYHLHVDTVYKNISDKMEIKKHFGPEAIANGDRLATLMIYMSDVEAGGRTIFNNIGLSVKPVKGGAAYWYNIDPYGAFDVNSFHAGCPVLLGHKWAANKWIRENANFLRRPCPLSKP